jgi:hypothetical protein
MNEFSKETGARSACAGNRHARHLRHLHRLHRLHRHLHRLEGTGRPDGLTRPSHHDHAGHGRNRRALYELHKALADVARTGNEQLRGEAAQIITEATARLNGLLAADQ